MQTKQYMKKIIILTAGPLTDDKAWLIRKLQASAQCQVVAVCIDEKPTNWWRRMQFLRRAWGSRQWLQAILYRLRQMATCEVPKRLWWGWHDLWLPPQPAATYEDLEVQQSTHIYRVPDIHAPETLSMLRDLLPDLGVIIGGRILKPALLDLFRDGVLNIHKHDARKYRGGAQIGYPERLNHDTHLGITIHWATAKVDAGDIVAQQFIEIEPFDTAASLSIRADIYGAQLYYEAIIQVITGHAQTLPQEANVPTLPTSPYHDRDQLWRRLRQQHKRALRTPGESWIQRVLKHGFRLGRATIVTLLLPILVRRTQPPLVILAYHGVDNHARTWLTLPLEDFHQQVQYLRRYYHIISLESALHMTGTPAGRPAAVLTFDDGYSNTLTHIAPYLKFYNLPASFFICAGATKAQNGMPHDKAHGFEAPILDIPGVQQLSNLGFSIGSHAMFHENMAQLPVDVLPQVLRESQILLQEWAQQPISVFAFPFGQPHTMSDAAIKAAENLYQYSLAAHGGYNDLPPKHLVHRIANPDDLYSLAAIMLGKHRL
jgi:peptidoglycan/xylan/chitin deacetylase (PgdA/CDA1 family)/folate-dependent phosphoribosylglycinamide formyltransferase PurN